MMDLLSGGGAFPPSLGDDGQMCLPFSDPPQEEGPEVKILSCATLLFPRRESPRPCTKRGAVEMICTEAAGTWEVGDLRTVCRQHAKTWAEKGYWRVK